MALEREARLLHNGPAMENLLNEDAASSGEGFEEARSRIGARARELQARVRHFVAEHPLGAVGIAFGVGYLLSGAIFSRATFKVVGVGSRLVAGGLLRQIVAGVGPAVLSALLSQPATQAPSETASKRDGGNRPST
jgi:ElaB/YqjD/DUF883 family membrane-anchored ribosome-binding protein